jgi:hypothetical protein
MTVTKTNKKKQVISFAIDAETARELRERPQYTKWIASIVAHNLDQCPLCHRKLEKKEIQANGTTIKV